jgi:site-specific recombinase XerD
MKFDFEPFLEHLAVNRRASPQTVRAYCSDLKLFETFARQRSVSRPAQVDHVFVREYIEHMQQQSNPRSGRNGLSDASVARRLAALSSYLEFVRATADHKLRNPLKDVSRRWHRNNDPKPVEEPDLEMLLDGITNERDRLLFTLFLATGLRVSEMQQLNRDSIRIECTTVGVEEQTLGVGDVVGKGDKRRRFYVDEATMIMCAAYLIRREDQHEALFLSERKQRMSVRAMQYTLDLWCRKVGIDHINIHRLRHSFATRLANSNISSLVLKDLMGHASFSTTARYFKLTDTTLARGYFSAMEFVRNDR